jgi:hypothetical protein
MPGVLYIISNERDIFYYILNLKNRLSPGYSKIYYTARFNCSKSKINVMFNL